MLKSFAAMAVTACTLGAVTFPKSPSNDFWAWWKNHYSGKDDLKITIIGKSGSGKSRLGSQLFEMQTGIRHNSFLGGRFEGDSWYYNVASKKSHQILEVDSAADRSFRLRDVKGTVINIRQSARSGWAGGDLYVLPSEGYSNEIVDSHVVLKTYRKNGKLMVRVWKSRFGPQRLPELVLT
jgi:hypothetical protein